MPASIRPAVIAGLLVLGAPASGRSESLVITHDPIGCVVAGGFPRVEADVAPGRDVARARVHFRAHGTRHWYFVEMTPTEGSFVGTLPRPNRDLARMDYYLEATSRAFAESRTAEFESQVVAHGAACAGKAATVVSTAVSILIGVPAGAPAIPAGFSGLGVVASSTGAAGATAAGAGAGGGGGGIGTTALVVGGVAAAAGVGALVASQALGSENTRTFFFEGHVYGRNTAATCGSQGASGNIGGSGCTVTTPAPGAPAGPSPLSGCSVLAGAIVSTSLDSVTATTNSQGYFHLVTGVRETQCETNGISGVPGTVTVSAPGCQTVTLDYQAGCHSQAISCLMHILLRCP